MEKSAIFSANSASTVTCSSPEAAKAVPLTGFVIEHRGYALGYGLCAALMVVGAALFIGSQRLPGLGVSAGEPTATGSADSFVV